MRTSNVIIFNVFMLYAYIRLGLSKSGCCFLYQKTYKFLRKMFYNQGSVYWFTIFMAYHSKSFSIALCQTARSKLPPDIYKVSQTDMHILVSSIFGIHIHTHCACRHPALNLVDRNVHKVPLSFFILMAATLKKVFRQFYLQF